MLGAVVGAGSDMDAKLVAWARAVKSRNRWRSDAWLPVLWVFTDDDRLPDPRPLLTELPPGLCGIVLRSRHRFDAGVVLDVTRRCRQGRVALVLGEAGGHRYGCGVHLGRRGRACRRARLVTASARSPAELRWLTRSAADCVFLSPVFATRSHPGASSLGVARWARLARLSPVPPFALGGITARTVMRLPVFCRGIGVIDAALPATRQRMLGVGTASR